VLAAGGPSTVYIVVPPPLWRTHGVLVRLWLSALLPLAGGSGLTFVVDEAAGLGLFDFLRAAQRQPGASSWSFWESLGQLSAAHPAEWTAFIGGCRSVQAVGPIGPAVAIEMAGPLGASAAGLIELAPFERLALAGEVAGPYDGVIPAPAPADSGPGHVVTFAPVAADGAVMVAGPLLAGLHGAAVVVDPFGRIHAATAVARAVVGPVVRLDPFGVLGSDADQFNPLDLLGNDSPFSDFLALGEKLFPTDPSTLDVYWRTNTQSLVEGILNYLVADPNKTCSLVELRNMLVMEDFKKKMSDALDTLKTHISSEARIRISNFLQHGSSELDSFITQAYHALRILDDSRVARSVEKTSFDLGHLAAGSPVTVYIVVPPLRSKSHGVLVHIWLTALLYLLTKAKQSSSSPPLLIIDEPYELGLFPILQRAQLDFPGDILSFWNSLGQLRYGYPEDWSAFLANARAVEVLGPQSPVVAIELSSVFGVQSEVLQTLMPGQRLSLSVSK
jgi:type IV secretion system protein VirD4